MSFFTLRGCDPPLTASQATALGSGSRHNEVLEPLHARLGARHAGWDSPGIHLRLSPFGSLVKDELGLGLHVRDAEVCVLEPFTFLAFTNAQASRFFLAQERGEAALLLPWEKGRSDRSQRFIVE